MLRSNIWQLVPDPVDNFFFFLNMKNGMFATRNTLVFITDRTDQNTICFDQVEGGEIKKVIMTAKKKKKNRSKIKPNQDHRH